MKECKVCDNLIPEKAPKNRVYCYECRPPKELTEIKEEKEEETEIKKEPVDKKKDKSRPIISSEKQFFILKEQNYECRGPGPKDNEEYECDMKKNKKKFSHKKSPDPQFDHIIRWKQAGEGCNNLSNIQALCPNCHWMKTKMENILEGDSECMAPRHKIILESMTKPKYSDINTTANIPKGESGSDSDDSDDDIIF
tara:strand:- start:141 stop:728 length:588 start_codon:yes stop_codon:yes gene_type:complete